MGETTTLYHYTSIESAYNIVNYKKLRMFDVTKQTDPDDFCYGANIIFDLINKKLATMLHSMDIESMRQKKILCILNTWLAMNAVDEERKNKFFESTAILPKNNKFYHLIEAQKKRKDVFHVASLGRSNENPYLWNTYANKGAVIELEFDHSIQPKTVNYATDEEMRYSISEYIERISQSHINPNNPNEVGKCITSIVHFCLSHKRENFVQEEESRMCIMTELNNDLQPRFIDTYSNRHYTELDISAFIKCVYFASNAPNEDHYIKLRDVCGSANIPLVQGRWRTIL